MGSYLEEIKKSMKLLDDNDYWIIGQNVEVGGTSMYHTYKEYFEGRRIELPVFEDIQTGISTGMSLEGIKVLSIYPRMDFLLLAMNQIVNHLDKARIMSDNQFRPRVIIRTCVGSVKPMMPGEQHCQNYVEALKSMCKDIEIIDLLKAEDIVPAYNRAINEDKSFIIVEHSDLYNPDMKEIIRRSKE